MKNLFFLISLICVTSIYSQTENEIITYYEDGRLKEKGILNKMGEKEGLWEEYKYYKPKGYYSKEGILLISNYKNGELNGTYLKYLIDGNKKDLLKKINYQNGKRVGEYEQYSLDRSTDTEYVQYWMKRSTSTPENVIIEKGNYILTNEKFSVKHGEWIINNYGGLLKEKNTYDEGIFIRFNKYYDTGKIKSEAHYFKDERNDSVISYFESGIISNMTLKKINYFKEIKNYDNGQLKSETENNLLSGYRSQKRFFTNGNLMTDSNNDSFIEYWRNGQLKEKGQWKDEEVTYGPSRTGVWELYYENGQLKEKNTYNERGENIGWTEIYYENGLLNEKVFHSNIDILTDKVDENSYTQLEREKLERERIEDSLNLSKEINLLGEAFNDNLKTTLSNLDETDLLKYLKTHSSFKQRYPQFKTCENNDPSCFQNKLVEIINRYFSYPEEAQERGVEGQFNVQFDINEKGLLENVRFKMITEPVLGPNDDLILDFINNGLLIVSKIPVLYPGIKDGVPVKVPYSIPWKYRLK